MPASDLQLDNDPALLELMLSDQAAADRVFRPTNYWSARCDRLAENIRANGLFNVRRDKAFSRHKKGTPEAGMWRFGVTDWSDDATPAAAWSAALESARGSPAVPLQQLPASRAGNPRGFKMERMFYTHSWLKYFARYAYVARFLLLDRQVVAEIGPGSGKQAHLLKQAHPGLTVLLFDVAPQLYIANQYLKKALGDDVIGYDRARRIGSFADIEPGKVHVMGSWQVPLLSTGPLDLFWSAASFQEMEPDVVAHYLSFVAHAENIYLMQAMGGQKVARRLNSGAMTEGVLEQTTLETYLDSLPCHEIIDQRLAVIAVYGDRNPYSDTFWRRRR